MKKILLILAVLVAFTANAQQMSKKEFAKLQKKAEAGDFESRCDLAFAIFMGDGCQADEQKGMEMLRALMEQYPDSGDVANRMACAMLSSKEPDTAMAIVYFNRGADLKDTRSMNDLGQSYLFGNFTEQDYAKAHSYFDRSVALESPSGNFWMGYMIYFGLGCDFSPAAAMPFLEKSYSLEHPYAANQLGDIYAEGNPQAGIAADHKKAVQCYLDAVKWGFDYAYMGLAALYRKSGDLDQADHYYQKAAKSGELVAYYEAADMYYDLENWEKCRQWCELGDKAGNKDCSRVLGYLYEYGLGVKVDNQKAARYYEKDTTDFSYNQLGGLYLEGSMGKKMTQQLFDKGVDYLVLAADKGNMRAAYTLGEIYREGCEFAQSDPNKSAHYYKVLAENDVPEGLFRLGQYYEEGIGGQQDTVKALQYMRDAAEREHPLALCYMGDYYHMGHIVDRKDQAMAMDYYKAAADKGSAAGYYLVGRTYLEQGDTMAAMPYLTVAANNNVHQAADRLGNLYNYGSIELVPSGDSALHYYVMAAQQGNPHSCYVVGRQLLREQANEMAVNFLTSGSRNGSDSAMVLLSRCMLQGVGVKSPDNETAYYLAKRATLYDNADGYYLTGLMTMNGIGCQPDEALGKSYLDTAASMGNSDAMLQLVYCYEGERGCDYDHATAISWLKKAASLDNVRAINHLITIYAEGDELVEKDEKKAFELAQYGADTLGSLSSLCWMGYFYQEGIGCVLNSDKAVECYTKAAENGSAEAMFRLAAFYDRDLYVDGDEDEVHIEGNPALSFEWLKKAADAGHVESMYYLGSLYETGNSVVKADKKLAKKYYKMAADNGMEAASAALYRLK